METKKMLVIDDEIDFCFLVCYYFNRKGVECHYACSLKETFKVVKSQMPDLILADKNFHTELESSLHAIIDSSDDYDPDVFLYNGKAPYESIFDDILRALDK